MALRVAIVEHKDAFKWMTPLGRRPESNPYTACNLEKSEQPTNELQAIGRLMKLPRALSILYLVMVQGFVLGGLLEGSMSEHVKSIVGVSLTRLPAIYLNYKYGYNSLAAGLVFIAAVAPTFVTSPLAGWATDKIGPKKIAIFSVLAGIPFLALLIIPQLPAAAFIVLLALMGCGNSAMVGVTLFSA